LKSDVEEQQAEKEAAQIAHAEQKVAVRAKSSKRGSKQPAAVGL
jgi:hypothetical protein